MRIITHRMILLSSACAAVLSLAACGTVSQSGSTSPMMTLEQVQPLPMNVGQVTVKGVQTQANIPANARPGADFGYDLGALLRNYAERRLKGDHTSTTTLLVNIDEAKVVYDRVEAQNDVTRWLRLDGHDDYTLSTRVRVTLQNADGRDQITNELALQNTLSLPDSLSLAQRDDRKLKFVENYLADLDRRITQTLTSRFFVAAPAQR